MTGFVAGGFVAIISTHFERRIVGKRQIHKVYKNGNFVLLDHEGKPQTQQWSQNHDGTIAHKTGDRGFRHSEHATPWTDDIVKEIAERKARNRRDHRRHLIVEALKGRYVDIPEHALHQIETALKFAGC
jgi:hypothetical protein